MSRLMNTLVFLFLAFMCHAQYVFTGNGAWSDPNNWQNGSVAPAGISSGTTITILGNAVNNVPSGRLNPDYQVNGGSLIIEAGGSLTFTNLNTWLIEFRNSGSVIINGTLTFTNSFVWEAYAGSSITVNGIFEHKGWIGNAGTITINNGGAINNTGTLDNAGKGFAGPGPIIVNCGGVINNIAPGIFYPGNTQLNGCGIINNASSLSGNLTFNGTLINSGTIAPGNSPGAITVSADYTAMSTAIHNFEIAGTATGNYDVMNVGGNVSLNGTLNVSLLNGFTPTSDHDLPIITGTINGSFSTVNIPSSYILVYNSNSVVLRHTSALPVHFVGVNIKKQNSGQEISWEVLEEENVLRYEVEKSRDGIHFTVIGSVHGAGLNTYRFHDAVPETKCFYRLKCVDIAGTHRYSTISFYNQGKVSTRLYAFPSPARQSITVQHATTSRTSTLYLISCEGKIIRTVGLPPRVQQTVLDVSSLKSGVYFIRFHSGKDDQTIMVEKL